MSADNYYVIYYQDGAFIPVMGFMSDDSAPEPHSGHARFNTLQEACEWAQNQWPEYGVTITQGAWEASYQGELLLPEEWCKIFSVTVIDPDGWDRNNFEESWNTRISRSEFLSKMMLSTVIKEYV